MAKNAKRAEQNLYTKQYKLKAKGIVVVVLKISTAAATTTTVASSHTLHTVAGE